MPEEARTEAERELNRLSKLSVAAAEEDLNSGVFMTQKECSGRDRDHSPERDIAARGSPLWRGTPA